MKRYLLFLLMCVCASVGAWAYSDSGAHITLSDTGDDTQTIITTEPGALADWYESLSDDQKSYFRNGSRTQLNISGPLNERDLAILNSTVEEGWSHFTSMDLKGATISETSDISFIAMSNLLYLRLPSNFNTPSLMSGLNQKNPKLQVAVSTDALGSSARKIVIQSFSPNGFNASIASLSLTNELTGLKYITMSGSFGDKDLYDNGCVFGGSPASWDFTGAGFESITLEEKGSFSGTHPYYANNDPFCKGDEIYPIYPCTTNAFYYFTYYAQNTVKISLPTEITELPDLCLSGFGSNGKNSGNYDLIYPDADDPDYVIDELVIPNNIKKIGYDCATGCKIRKVTIGNGIEEICGGAFANSNDIEEVDFVPGVTRCVLGNGAFNEGQNSKMKHIVLPEGITSIGADCFRNSQQLESIRLPVSLEYIGNGCFYDCHALSSITIPENVKQIGKAAFSLTALKDVYLTTTDPAKIPFIYTAGTQWTDNDCTFGINEEYGNNSVPGTDPGYGDMTWDEIVDYLFTHSNRIATLHFPKILRGKVRADICNNYSFTSKDDYKIPSQANVSADVENLRGDIPNADISDPGSTSGKYSQDGWAQFVLMKEYDPDTDTEVYEKEYDDVWYTMCFPFDLTDEQLAGAFTENFNIVDFSAVEITTDEATQKKELVLHFNNVAETVYKDADNNEYVRKRNGAGGLEGDVVRLDDGNYSYNVYYRVNSETKQPDTSVEYKHVQVGQNGGVYKTKTFAAGGNKDNGVVMIDGYLALAGHPYMIHPNTGAKNGSPKVRCHFSGITWIPVEEREALYEAQARTVDLNIATTENNFNQVAYGSAYAGQTYTFKGNWREYSAEGEGYATSHPEPVLTAVKPVESEYMTRGDEPVEPKAVDNPGEDPSLNPVLNPNDDVTNYPLTFQEFANTSATIYYDGSSHENTTWGQAVAYCSDIKGFTGYSNDQYCWFTNGGNSVLNNYLKNNGYLNYDNNQAMSIADALLFKQKCSNYVEAKASYSEWLTDKESYTARKNAYDKYLQDYDNWRVKHDLWSNWTEETARQRYQDALTAYNEAVEEYDSQHEDWVDAMKDYFVLIPKNAYFLGRKPGKYPKYYRETAPDDVARTTGLWKQYTAVILPSSSAVNGIESEIDPSVAASRGFDMKFNEDFEGEMIDKEDITGIIEVARKDGEPKVEYMNVVVNINGQVVRNESTSIEGLPSGIYIVNGKKYFVK